MTAQALATSLGVPAYGVCTLDAVAYGSGLTEPFLVATDARRKEVFWGHYQDLRTRLSGPAVDKPQELPGEIPLVGAGGRMYAETVGASRLLDAPDYPFAGCSGGAGRRAARRAGCPGGGRERHASRAEPAPPDLPAPPRRPGALGAQEGLRVTAVLRQMTVADLPAVMEIERETFPARRVERGHAARRAGRPAPDPPLRGGPGGRRDRRLRRALSPRATRPTCRPSRSWPKTSGTGIGGAMLTELLAEAVRRGAREIFLEVRADNPGAQGVYGDFGFEGIGVRRRYYEDGTDAIMMKKEAGWLTNRWSWASRRPATRPASASSGPHPAGQHDRLQRGGARPLRRGGARGRLAGRTWRR